MPEPEHWGLMALGVSGQWQLELLEPDVALPAEDAWRLLVDGPTASVILAVRGPAAVEELQRFMEATAGQEQWSQLAIGRCLGHPAVIVRDRGRADRYFIKVAGEGTLCEVTLVDDDLAQFREALRRLLVDLHQQ